MKLCRFQSLKRIKNPKMETKTKRNRSSNFEKRDKILLIRLVKKREEIIENKCVDTETSRKKRLAWGEITNIFNNNSSVKRTTNQLQKLWRGTKFKKKVSVSDVASGCELSKSSYPVDERLMDIPLDFRGEENAYDYDVEDCKPDVSNISIGSFKNENELDIVDGDATFFPETGNDNELKNKLLECAIENRQMEKKFMQLEHEEKMKTIAMERVEKLKTFEMERIEKKLTMQMERKHKEEIHRLKIEMMTQNSNFKFFDHN